MGGLALLPSPSRSNPFPFFFFLFFFFRIDPPSPACALIWMRYSTPTRRLSGSTADCPHARGAARVTRPVAVIVAVTVAVDRYQLVQRQIDGQAYVK